MKRLVKRWCNKIYAIKKNVKIGKNTDIHISNVFEGKNFIGSNTTIARSMVGFGTYICDNSFFDKASIGRYCAIGTNVKVILAQHPTRKFVSIHPAFYSTREQAGFSYVEKDEYNEFRMLDEKCSVMIGNDVWIGDDVKIMGGIRIGNGAVIGAGSIVTKDIPPYAIFAGIPAKKIGQRFTDEQIDFLKKVEWWNKEESWIMNNKSLFKDIDEFASRIILCEE